MHPFGRLETNPYETKLLKIEKNCFRKLFATVAYFCTLPFPTDIFVSLWVYSKTTNQTHEMREKVRIYMSLLCLYFYVGVQTEQNNQPI